MIAMSEYAQRRKALMQSISSDGIIILPSASEIPRNGDSTYQFRQSSNFYYLTGFEEPDAVLVLLPNRKEGEYVLFNRKRDRTHEVWDGPRAGLEGACKHYLADQAVDITEFEEKLSDLVAGKASIHYPLGVDKKFDGIMMRCLNGLRAKIRSGVLSPIQFVDIEPIIHEMRLYKSPAEIAVMQKAVDITQQAHIRAMQVCKPGMYEYQLEAELLHEFKQQGVQSPAYTSIVGAGANTCVLHYVSNNQKIKDNDLVLIDAGAEYQNYAADITRTFPANGRFSAEQRAIYELVLESQRVAIQALKPGVSWMTAQNNIVTVITQGLIDLGILKGKRDVLIEKQAYLPFYMHRSGHWLGLDVHDAGCYRQGEKWCSLKPGMVLTVEPGIYISSDIPGVEERWHHIGVRIEDDILVTAEGCDVLSKAIPKEIVDVEAVMAK